jgi:hypothetical protein
MPFTGKFTNYASAAVMNHIFGGVPLQMPTQWYVGYMLGTASVTAPGAEPNGAGYDRAALPNTTSSGPGTGSFAPSTAQTKTNAVEVVFNPATANHGLVQSVGLFDSPTGGNMWFYFPLQSPKQIDATDAMRVPSGSLSVQMGAGLLSNTVKNAVLNHLLGGVAYNTTPVYYAAYTTSASTDAVSGAEPAGNGYARVSVPNNANMFPSSMTGAKSNGLPITFPEATGNQGTIVGVTFHTGVSGGQFIAHFEVPNQAIDVAITPNAPTGLIDLLLN